MLLHVCEVIMCKETSVHKHYNDGVAIYINISTSLVVVTDIVIHQTNIKHDIDNAE